MPFKKAKFVVAKEKREIPVHFNPAEYIIESQGKSAEGDLAQLREETLSLRLYFDTYMKLNNDLSAPNTTAAEREDVRSYTDPIVKLVERNAKEDILVYFIWGSLNFKGFISSVSQRYTMFMDDGKPVRAVLDVTMKGINDMKVKPPAGKGEINWSDDDWKKIVKTQNGKVRELLRKNG